MSETTVGQIIGYLRLDTSHWDEEIDKADRKVDDLGRKDPKIRIELNAAEVIGKIEAVTAAVDRMDKNNTRLSLNANTSLKAIERGFASTGATVRSETAKTTTAIAKTNDELDKTTGKSQQAGRGMGVLAQAIITLGPALVPLAVGATGLAVGYTAMGAAGVAAIVGIKHEMAAGTALGVTYTGQINTLKNDMYSLGRVAASGVLGPFQSTVATLQRMMPGLTGQVRDFSTITGKTAGNLTVGLLAAFVALEPVMRDVGVYTLDLSTRFEHLMSGPGVVSFGDYVRSVFPQVMAAVESLVGATIHLVAAFAPLGLGVLSEVRMLADLLNALPVNVLQQLATAASAAYLGFKGYGLVAGQVDGLGKALRAIGLSAEAAAAGMDALKLSAVGIGALIAVATILYTQHAEAVRQDQQAVNDYTDALRQSNGVINESIRQKVAQKLADMGLLQTARELGLSLSDVTSAAMGQTDAQGRLNTQIDAQKEKMRGQVNATGDAGQAYDVFNGKVFTLTKGIGLNNSELQRAIQQYKDQQAAVSGATGATSAQAAAQQGLATGLHSSTTALQAAVTAQQQQKDSASAATTQMQLENDAAGLLKQSLDALNGKAISAADAQQAFDSSLVNMGDHVTKTGKKVRLAGDEITGMTASAVALRGELNGQVKNLQGVIEANGGLANSTGKARAQMVAMRQQIIDNAVAHGVDRGAVTAYIDRLLAIPKTVPPTKLDVDAKAALLKIQGLQLAINSLTGKTVTIYTQAKISGSSAAVAAAMNAANSYALSNAYRSGAGVTAGPPSTGKKPAAKATGGDVPGYAGGTLIGPGSGMSDSILAMVAQTSQLVRLSTGEFISTSASRSRNRAALEAGNRGAQLQVAGRGGGTVQHFHLQPTDPYVLASELSRRNDLLGV